VPDLLDRRGILAALRELTVELGPGAGQHVVVVAGGSLMALHGMREATRDVDSVAHLDAELRSAADRVAASRGLEAGHWLTTGPKTGRTRACP